MVKKDKIKTIILTVIFTLSTGVAVAIPGAFALSQNYIAEYSANFDGGLVAWGDTYHYSQGATSSRTLTINLPYSGVYDIWTLFYCNGPEEQQHEEYKIFVNDKYINRTHDCGTDCQKDEYLGESSFEAGNHQIRADHLWNSSDWWPEEGCANSVRPLSVTFSLKEIFAPELSISKSVDKSAAQPGEILTYSLSYKNTGKAGATGVVLSDDFNENYLDIYDRGGGTVAGGKISWNIGTLETNISGTKIFKVKVKNEMPQGTTYIYNKALIESAQTDTLESNTISTIVTSINHPPVADAGPDKDVYEGESITLNGSGSDPDGDDITYSWNCNGGSLFNANIAQPTYYAPSVSGDTTYTCTLTVTDEYNLSDSDSMNVLVRVHESPTLYVSFSTNPTAGCSPLNDVDLTATVSGTASGNITYFFDCTNDGIWERIYTSVYNSWTAYDICHYSPPGTYWAKVRVEREGLSAEKTSQITVYSCGTTNHPPVADAGPDKDVYEGESITLNGSGSDPDGDPITYRWSCSGGSLSNRYIAQPSYTAPYISYERTYTCTLTLTDDKGLSDSDSMQVRVLDRVLSPEVETNSATNVQTDQATLNGYLQNLGGVDSCNVWFQWGETSSYGQETAHYWKGSTGSFNYTISGLSQDTTYHFRAVGENSQGISYGQDRTFRTKEEKEVSLIVKKSVKNLSRGDTTWYKSLKAAPSDKLLFRIIIKSTGDAVAQNVRVKDTLPSRIIYQGKLKIDDTSKTKNISTRAINIGDLASGQSKTITFEAKVASEGNFSYGMTDLINTVMVYTEETSDTDTCKVMVRKKAVAGAVTEIPTGITNRILDSILLPLGIALTIVWIFKSKLIGLDKWIEERQKEIGEYRAKKNLKRRISQLKAQGYFKE